MADGVGADRHPDEAIYSRRTDELRIQGLQQLVQEAATDKKRAVEVVPDSKLLRLVNSMLVWMCLSVAFLPAIWIIAVIVRDCSLSRDFYYGLTLSMLILLMLFRCIGTDWNGSWSAVSVGFAVPGLTLFIFGLGTEVLLVSGKPGIGSVRRIRSMMRSQPPPNRFLFSDGFVAHNMAVTHRTCWQRKPGWLDNGVYAGQCYHYSMAPVFAAASDAAVNVSSVVRAWAVPRGTGRVTFEGFAKDIPQDRCGEGLCGLLMTPEVRRYGHKRELHLTRRFNQLHPHKAVNSSSPLPFICFADPEWSMNILRQCWMSGVILVFTALLITLCEATVLCEEVLDERAFWIWRNDHGRIRVYDSDSDAA